MKTKQIIERIKALGIDSDATTQYIEEKIWNNIDELTIKRLEKFEKPIVTIHNHFDTVIISYWDAVDYTKSWTIEVDDCYISDDQCADYYNGLALFLNVIRNDIRLCDMFYFGLCIDEETDEVYFDEEEWFENLYIPFVSEIVSEHISFYCNQ